MFLNRLKTYVEKDLPKEQPTPQVVINRNYYESPCWYYRPFWWGGYHHETLIIQSDSNDSSREKKSKSKTGLDRIFPLILTIGLGIGGFYYFYDQYLSYQQGVKLLKEVKNDEKNHPRLCRVVQPYLQKKTKYLWKRFLAQTMLASSLMILLCDWLFWEDESIMYITLGSGTVAGVYWSYVQLNYNYTNPQTSAIEINKQVSRILDSI